MTDYWNCTTQIDGMRVYILPCPGRAYIPKEYYDIIFKDINVPTIHINPMSGSAVRRDLRQYYDAHENKQLYLLYLFNTVRPPVLPSNIPCLGEDNFVGLGFPNHDYFDELTPEANRALKDIMIAHSAITTFWERMTDNKLLNACLKPELRLEVQRTLMSQKTQWGHTTIIIFFKYGAWVYGYAIPVVYSHMSKNPAEMFAMQWAKFRSSSQLPVPIGYIALPMSSAYRPKSGDRMTEKFASMLTDRGPEIYTNQPFIKEWLTATDPNIHLFIKYRVHRFAVCDISAGLETLDQNAKRALVAMAQQYADTRYKAYHHLPSESETRMAYTLMRQKTQETEKHDIRVDRRRHQALLNAQSAVFVQACRSTPLMSTDLPIHGSHVLQRAIAHIVRQVLRTSEFAAELKNEMDRAPNKNMSTPTAQTNYNVSGGAINFNAPMFVFNNVSNGCAHIDNTLFSQIKELACSMGVVKATGVMSHIGVDETRKPVVNAVIRQGTDLDANAEISNAQRDLLIAGMNATERVRNPQDSLSQKLGNVCFDDEDEYESDHEHSMESGVLDSRWK